MKIFKEKKKEPKSWVIKLTDDENLNDDPQLVAVDSRTGKLICHLITFETSGQIRICQGAFDELETQGYDPYEHGNEFNGDGALETFYE